LLKNAGCPNSGGRHEYTVQDEQVVKESPGAVFSVKNLCKGLELVGEKVLPVVEG